MRRSKKPLVVLLTIASVVGMTAPALALGSGAADSGVSSATDTSTTMNHSAGNPPEDPGNNGSEVPGIGRPPCIPPQDPGHGQPSCIPPDHANNPDNANKSSSNGGMATTMNHSAGNPPDDPGNNGSEVPGIGRPPCIPPQDPGHGQPSCIPPDHANNPDNANKSNGGGNNAGGNGGGNGNAGGNSNSGGSSASGIQGILTTFTDLLGL